MSMIGRIVSTALFALITCSASAQSWWDGTPWKDPDRGFNWYPPDEVPVKPKEAEKRAPKTLGSIKTIEDLREEIEWRKGQAIMEPTQETLYAYLEAQKYAMTKAGQFSDVWRRTVWSSSGDLVFANQATTNGTAAQDRELKLAARNNLVRSLGKDYGLYFFYKADCKYCHLQAPVMKQFAMTFNFPVMAIGLDNSKIKDFPDARPDNGISLIASGGAGIRTTPAVYLLSRKDRAMLPIAVGTVSVDELADRIRVIVATKVGDEL